MLQNTNIVHVQYLTFKMFMVHLFYNIWNNFVETHNNPALLHAVIKFVQEILAFWMMIYFILSFTQCFIFIVYFWTDPKTRADTAIPCHQKTGARVPLINSHSIHQGRQMKKTLQMMLRGYGVQTSSRVSRKLLPSTLPVVDEKLFFQMKERCMVRSINKQPILLISNDIIQCRCCLYDKFIMCTWTVKLYHD